MIRMTPPPPSLCLCLRPTGPSCHAFELVLTTFDSQVTTDARQIAPAPRRTPRDPALDGLDMSRWTTVLISNDTAARAISLYLTTDHLLLCPFDRKLFITSLVSPDTTSYCKPALVNALMYWCCVGVLICYYTKSHLTLALADLRVYRARDRYQSRALPPRGGKSLGSREATL